MLTYGGVPLAQPDPEVLDWVRNNISPDDIFDFEHLVTTTEKLFWPFPGQLKDRGVKPGTLYWPSGASQWAVGYFFATDAMLALIRPLTYAPAYSVITAAVA